MNDKCNYEGCDGTGRVASTNSAGDENLKRCPRCNDTGITYNINDESETGQGCPECGGKEE